MIKLEDVTKSYRNGKETMDVLKNINLEIRQGDFVAIMGPSGSGKSTLMNIIGCLDRPTSGAYYFEGKDISSLDDQELAKIRNKKIGFVFQQFHLLPRLSALKNVELPMIYAGIGKKQRDELAKQALIKVGLGDRIQHMPNELSGAKNNGWQ